MIKRKSIFVLGAGASRPFGFPLGSGLKELVLANYQGDVGHAVHLYNTTRFTRAEVEALTKGLRFSGLSSVDAFLERRPSFIEVGKATMGIELLLAESSSTLLQADSDWLGYLYNRMVGRSLEEFADNQVAFITFNYDRNVEHFLFTSLQHSFGASTEATAAVMGRIPIIHLHGRLGALPWQDARRGIPYGASGIDTHMMNNLVDQIKVVHEDITEVRDKEFTRSKQLLAEAERVFLLGFGFGSLNVERLGLADIKPHFFEGTSYGMTPKETRECRAMVGEQLNLHHNWAALDFLRNVAPLN